MTEACSRYGEKDAAIECYTTLIAGMRENRAWCHSFGMNEATELQVAMSRSRDRIVAAWTSERQEMTEEFRRLAEEHVATMRSTPNPGLKAQIAAKWYQIEIEYRRKRDEREAKKSLKQLYDDFGALAKMVDKLECP